MYPENKLLVNSKAKNVRRMLIIVLIVLIISLIATATAYFFYKKNHNKIAQTPETIDQIYDKDSRAMATLVGSIKSLDEFKNIDTEKQSQVGIALIQKNSELNNQLAIDVANYLIQKDGSNMEILSLAYRLETDSIKRQKIVDQINAVAREEGIIGQNETLPSRTYDGTEGGLQ